MLTALREHVFEQPVPTQSRGRGTQNLPSDRHSTAASAAFTRG
jgi:hypothetical protein